MRNLKDLETKIQELELESEEIAKLARTEAVHQLMRFFILNIDKFTIQKYEQGQRFSYESGTEYVYTGSDFMTIPGMSEFITRRSDFVYYSLNEQSRIRFAFRYDLPDVETCVGLCIRVNDLKE